MAILKSTIEQVVIIAPGQRYPGDWRVLRGITQPGLAAGAKIATTTLRGIERADIALTDANAATLAGLLGIGVDEYRAAYQRARVRPPGTTVWTVAHRGYSGKRRLDVWIYRDDNTALRAAAELAMSCGVDEDTLHSPNMFRASRVRVLPPLMHLIDQLGQRNLLE